jgi:hypothetical protein
LPLSSTPTTLNPPHIISSAGSCSKNSGMPPEPSRKNYIKRTWKFILAREQQKLTTNLEVFPSKYPQWTQLTGLESDVNLPHAFRT